jgi:hypothetical protein
MSHSIPFRRVKCQKCSWSGDRTYVNGILCDPCPDCGRRCIYATSQAGDQPVTTDTGQEVTTIHRPGRRVLTPERKAQLASYLATARERKLHKAA